MSSVLAKLIITIISSFVTLLLYIARLINPVGIVRFMLVAGGI